MEGLKGQPAAPVETFARFQLPALIDSLMLAAGWLAGWLAVWPAGLYKALLDSSWLLSEIFFDFLRFSLIFIDFYDFHRFRSMGA